MSHIASTRSRTCLSLHVVIMFTILHTHTLATYLIQREEGFILQGFQVDLKQTGQVLCTEKRGEGQRQEIKQQ